VTRIFPAKAWLGGTGLAAGLVGMALAWRWLVFVAVGLLVAAFLLRFAGRKTTPPHEP
jgi:membrane protein implicated in regulation of membrane protease activity